MQATPAGTVPMTRSHPDELHPPDSTPSPQPTCGSDPKTGQPFRFNPQTGQPCNGMSQERVVVRQPNAVRPQPAIAPIPTHEETPEERRIAAAYQFEQTALQAPTTIRNPSATPALPSTAIGQPWSTDRSPVETLSRVLGARQSGDSARNGQNAENDYDAQNMQSRKEAFLIGARTGQADDYLRSTREAPLSRYEIKAGWEFPAVLEQSLNSDLPGELNALVTSSVYDTATGLYLLIPQGSRLIGKYDSRIPTARTACKSHGVA